MLNVSKNELSDVNCVLRQGRGFDRLECKSNAEIKAWQEQKKEWMKAVKDSLTAIDEGRDVNPYAHFKNNILWVEEGAEGLFVDVEGTKTSINFQQLLRGHLWGIHYAIRKSDESNKSVVHLDRLSKKRYVLTVISDEIAKLYNKQLCVLGMNGLIGGRQKSYEALLQRERPAAGHLAEIFIYSLLKKYIAEHSLPYDLVKSNYFEDVAGKIDFVVSSRNTGKKVGIQFTVMKQRDLGSKKNTLNRYKRVVCKRAGLEDLILIQMRIGRLVKLTVKQWMAKDLIVRASTTPDDFIAEKTRKKIVNKFFTELNEMNF